MRLLNTTDLTLHEFSETAVPTYAIVSHCWSQDTSKPEITYQQLLARDYKEEAYGWQKVVKGCKIARSRNVDWMWIDTCCIDKSSSAELTETINSMFLWYRRAKECYVLLDDVFASKVSYPDGITRFQSTPEAFCKSRWFTRGWTLQELLAPRQVNFFDQGGELIACRFEQHSLISRATGIDSDYLLEKKDIYQASIAQRMSWASKRQTTRLEDQAYSLLGLFDVNLPLLYGEGVKSFLRLQHAVIQQSNDSTIFAWGIDRSESSRFGVLADCPSNFLGSENVVKASSVVTNVIEPTQVTNKGVAYPYTTTAGDLMLSSNSQLDHTPSPERRKEIQLPCAIDRQSDAKTTLVLFIKRGRRPGEGFIRDRVATCRKSVIARFLHSIFVYQSKIYLSYSSGAAEGPDDISWDQTQSLVITEFYRRFVVRPAWFTLRAALSVGLCIACWRGSEISLEWNAMLTFGLLITARDMAKCWPLIIYVENILVLALGFSLWVQARIRGGERLPAPRS